MMHMGVTNLDIDPTKPAPWYAALFGQALDVFQAERLRKENLKRINAGLPPLTAAQSQSLAPTANVNIGLPPELKYGLLAGGAFLLYLLATRK